MLAIDLGTSGPKVGLVASDGTIVDHEFEATGHRLISGGGAEQDPEGWFRAVVAATRRMLSRERIQRSRIRAVSVTAQWSGTVPVGHDDRPVHDALIWMDSRGARHVHRLMGGPLSVGGYAPHKIARWLYYTGGGPGLAGKDPLAHILYLMHERPRVYADTRVFLEPKDYLNFRLTGRVAATFDSIALHWLTDNRRPDAVTYQPSLLRAAGIERSKLPDLCAATTVLGPLSRSAAELLGLSDEVVVVGGTPDVQSAAIGAGAVRHDDAHLYVGTSSWLVTHTDTKKTDVLHNMAALPAPFPDRYIVLNSQESAGVCVSHVKDNLLFADDSLSIGPAPADVYARLDAEAKKAKPGSNRLVFLPWLYGERTPVEDHALRGALFNYSLGTTRAEVIRCVYEGVAYNTRWLFEHVERFAKRRFSAIRFVGGGARSDVWAQIFADVLERPLLRVAEPWLANVRGAGILAWIALGECTAEQVASLAPVEREFLPNPQNADVYRRLFSEFLELYRSNRAIFARLNGP